MSPSTGAGDAEVRLVLLLAGTEHGAARTGCVLHLVLLLLDLDHALVLLRPRVQPRLVLLRQHRLVRRRRQRFLGLRSLRPGHAAQLLQPRWVRVVGFFFFFFFFFLDL